MPLEYEDETPRVTNAQQEDYFPNLHSIWDTGMIQTLLAEHPRITGVVAGNDLIAVGIIVAAAERGRNCPRDISVVGFNDMLLAGRLQPPLTTIRIPQHNVGTRAAELLMALVADPARSPETVLISGELVVRGSTAPPPASD